MGNCSSQCDKNLNDANEVQINENPEKDDNAGGGPYKKKKQNFPKMLLLKMMMILKIIIIKMKIKKRKNWINEVI